MMDKVFGSFLCLDICYSPNFSVFSLICVSLHPSVVPVLPATSCSTFHLISPNSSLVISHTTSVFRLSGFHCAPDWILLFAYLPHVSCCSLWSVIFLGGPVLPVLCLYFKPCSRVFRFKTRRAHFSATPDVARM
ncbi:hypothetical protein AMECASPLE_019226 [Ameca splendens]|uniref:Uncharacterized protein n=1 Tax=Ameca splendens TaxID=208324 RepID=A0ABV0Y312_9TELE